MELMKLRTFSNLVKEATTDNVRIILEAGSQVAIGNQEAKENTAKQ